MKTHKETEVGKPHTISPPTFSLFNFLDHALQGVIYKRDCTIASVKLHKLYDDRPRTEITITRLKNEKTRKKEE